jgi:hypothetical protein
MFGKRYKNQTGFALLLMLVVLIGVASLGLSNILEFSVKHRDERNKTENTRVLLEAKEALLSYAVNYAVKNDMGKMGRLPCPDKSSAGTEGNQDPNCGGPRKNTFGLFPFKSLGKGKLEDASNECLWYIVSGDYKENFPSKLLNWDAVGYLNLVDENGILKHGALANDFPIAFIISPGATINQARSKDASFPECKASNNIVNYLEGGPSIDYATDLLATADTLWEILTTPESASLGNVNYNDQVVAVYRDELWDRVKLLGDLSFNNEAGVEVASKIELLTKSLAECIAAYGNEALNVYGQLPYPAPVDLDPTNADQDEYRNEDNYDDSNAIRYGRFPQVLDDSVRGSPSFVLDVTTVPASVPATTVKSYCERLIPVLPSDPPLVTDYDEGFWNNWKDHFFYVVSEDFDSNPGPPTPTPKDGTKCTAGNCITINGGEDKVAAMVLFAGEVQVGQNRIWWWDEPSASVGSDFKSSVSNYLETGNKDVYLTGIKNYTISNFDEGELDYQYCVEYQNVSTKATSDYQFVAIKCSDLDGVNDAHE